MVFVFMADYWQKVYIVQKMGLWYIKLIEKPAERGYAKIQKRVIFPGHTADCCEIKE